ncbi:MAG: thermonuclease family protein, partial [Actinomycetota bacterium]|nr:thermonuclease family protein [Actinomycetota bacterium]
STGLAHPAPVRPNAPSGRGPALLRDRSRGHLARLSIVLAAVLLALPACSQPVDLSHQAPATLGEEPVGYEMAKVTRVVDGDTIEVTITSRVEGAGAGRAQVGQSYDVRLLGIDTPESVKPDSPVECFGPEASEAAAALLQDRAVRLVDDVEEVDGYGRLLRYVYVEEELANARLVANGYARVLIYEPNVRHSAFLLDLEDRARAAERGLWATDTCGRGGS